MLSLKRAAPSPRWLPRSTLAPVSLRVTILPWPPECRSVTSSFQRHLAPATVATRPSPQGLGSRERKNGVAESWAKRYVEAVGCPSAKTPLSVRAALAWRDASITSWPRLDCRSCRNGDGVHHQAALGLHSGFFVGVYSLSLYLSQGFPQGSRAIYP